jgi:outer membrane protein assembly factor BamB
MRLRFFRLLVVVACFGLVAPGASFWAFPMMGAVNVTEHHNHDSRDGLYVDPAFTQAAAAALKRDLSFNGSIAGNVYAQPLYIEGGPSGKAMIIAVTESNNVYALDAGDGTVIWKTHVGAPVPLSSLPCGNINPLGITGTPIIDLPSRSLFFDAMTTPDNGTTKEHMIFSLNVDTGTTNAGWPVNVNASARFGNTEFISVTQGQRGALALFGGYLYVPYGGNYGDCGTYHGWLVGMPLTDPTSVLAWATAASGGGAWAVGGPASDGLNVFFATGNTFNASVWSGGEAIIRFQPGPVFSGLANDYWTPTNWMQLDNTDSDLDGSGAMIVDVPGASPSNLVVALGKDGNAYLLNRTNLGGISLPLAKAHVSSSSIIQAGDTYQTTNGTYVVFCCNSTELAAFRITATSPPTITNAWTANQNGRGSPFVTSTDGTNNVVVWGIGSEGTQRLYGFDGDTGAVVFSGGGANELMANTRRFNTGIVARGRIFLANDNKVYAFNVPVPPFLLQNPAVLPGTGFEFSFTNTPGLSFTVFGTTDLSLPFSNWPWLGMLTDSPPGLFQFIDSQTSSNAQRFYHVRSP